jgi:hypothetical protein
MALTHKTASTAWDHLLTKMIQATQEAMIDASSRNVRHTAEQGKVEKINSDSGQYTFLLKEDWEPVTNTRIHIQLDPADPERTLTGTILSLSSTTLTFVTEAPLPQCLLKRMTFFEDNAWLLERLREALIRLQTQGETPAQMGAKTLGLLPAFEGRGRRQAQIATFLPNADQAKAIALGMESELLLVIGPAGTGKTATESALVLEHLLAGKTVLLTAYTNKALDTAMKRVSEYCAQSGHASLIQNHQIVRIGMPVDLDKEIYRDITVQGIVDQHLGALALERDRLQREQSELQEDIARCAAALDMRKAQWGKQRVELQAQYEALHQERA